MLCSEADLTANHAFFVFLCYYYDYYFKLFFIASRVVKSPRRGGGHWAAVLCQNLETRKIVFYICFMRLVLVG